MADTTPIGSRPATPLVDPAASSKVDKKPPVEARKADAKPATPVADSVDHTEKRSAPEAIATPVAMLDEPTANGALTRGVTPAAVTPPVDAAVPSDQTRPDPALLARRDQVARDIVAARAVENDPSNQYPEFAPGQGIIRRLDARNVTAEYSITGMTPAAQPGGEPTYTVRAEFEMGTPTRTLTRTELQGMLRDSNGQLQVVASQRDIQAARVLSPAETARQTEVARTQELANLQMQIELGPKRTHVMQELLARRGELTRLGDALNSQLAADLQTPSVTRGAAELITGDREYFGRSEVRGQIERNTAALAEIDRAMLDVRDTGRIGFEPQYDGVTVAMRDYLNTPGAEPSWNSQIATSVSLMRGAIERGNRVDAELAYGASLQRFFNSPADDGSSMYRTSDGKPSLLAAVNETIGNPRNGGDRSLALSSQDLAGRRAYLLEHWNEIQSRYDGLRNGGTISGPNGYDINLRDPARRREVESLIDGEVSRLAALERNPSHAAMEREARAANALVPSMRALEPGIGSQALTFVKGLADDPRFYAGMAVGIASEGLGAVAVGSELFGGASAGLMTAARVAGASERAIAGLSRGSVFVTHTAVTGAAFQSGMNIYDGLTGHADQADWSLGGFARSMALTGVSRFAGMRHAGRVADLPPSLATRFGEQLRYLGEESIGLGMVTGVDAALRSGGNSDNAMHELQANTQTLVAMRLAFGARSLAGRVFRGQPGAAADAPLEPNAAMRNVDAASTEVRDRIARGESPNNPEFQDAMRRLGRSYDDALTSITPTDGLPMPSGVRPAVTPTTPVERRVPGADRRVAVRPGGRRADDRPPSVQQNLTPGAGLAPPSSDRNGVRMTPGVERRVPRDGATPRDAAVPQMQQQEPQRWQQLPQQQQQANTGGRTPPVDPQMQRSIADIEASPTLRDNPLSMGVRDQLRALQGADATGPARSITVALDEVGNNHPEIAGPLMQRFSTVLRMPARDPARTRALADLETRAERIATETVEASGALRPSLPAETVNQRLAAMLDPSRSVDDVVASFPRQPALNEVPIVGDYAAMTRAIAEEPAATRRARETALADYDKQPSMLDPRGQWALAGDRFVRDGMKGAIFYPDAATAVRAVDQLAVARQSHARPILSENARGVQTYEPPATAPGVPAYPIEYMLPRGFRPDRPTLVYATEAVTPPFLDGHVNANSSIGKMLGSDLNGLGDVNVVLVRQPFQGAPQQGPFQGSLNNMASGLATTTSLMNDIVSSIRARQPAGQQQPVIMAGYSAGGSLINQYRGWFDQGRPGQGADFYIPMGAPERGYGGLFDSRYNGGQPTWLDAHLDASAWPMRDRIAEDLSVPIENIRATRDKTFAIVAQFENFVPGIPVPGGDRHAILRGAGHTTAVLDRFTPTTWGELNPNMPAMMRDLPVNWPSQGTVGETARAFRDVFGRVLRQETLPDGQTLP